MVGKAEIQQMSVFKVKQGQRKQGFHMKQGSRPFAAEKRKGLFSITSQFSPRHPVLFARLCFSDTGGFCDFCNEFPAAAGGRWVDTINYTMLSLNDGKWSQMGSRNDAAAIMCLAFDCVMKQI